MIHERNVDMTMSLLPSVVVAILVYHLRRRRRRLWRRPRRWSLLLSSSCGRSLKLAKDSDTVGRRRRRRRPFPVRGPKYKK